MSLLLSTAANGNKTTAYAATGSATQLGFQIIGAVGDEVEFMATNDPLRQEWWPVVRLTIASGEDSAQEQLTVFAESIKYQITVGTPQVFVSGA